MELIDTHCHIQSVDRPGGEHYTREKWREHNITSTEVLQAASAAGVKKMICVGCDLNDSRLATQFVKEYPNTWAAIGIHPHEAKHFVKQTEKLAEFTELASAEKVVAVGECGLDLHYSHSKLQEQLEILKFQLELAEKFKLPLIFHVRSAFEQFWPLFDKYQGARGVLHSFTDSPTNLAKALERGLFIGVNGIATFTKDEEQKRLFKAIPSTSLLLETDAPFLTPTPNRGKINQPKYLGDIAKFLADLRDESLENLAKATTANAHQLFGI